MEQHDNLYTNLVILLKIFKDRPNHLAKYLIDNNSLRNDFIDKLIKSDKLNSLSNKTYDEIKSDVNIYFSDFMEIDKYYNDLIKHPEIKTNSDNITLELNQKLSECLLLEKYEEAALIRDYMKSKNINIDNTFI